MAIFQLLPEQLTPTESGKVLAWLFDHIFKHRPDMLGGETLSALKASFSLTEEAEIKDLIEALNSDAVNYSHMEAMNALLTMFEEEGCAGTQPTQDRFALRDMLNGKSTEE